jgi:3-dehydrosphinganine reductase
MLTQPFVAITAPLWIHTAYSPPAIVNLLVGGPLIPVHPVVPGALVVPAVPVVINFSIGAAMDFYQNRNVLITGGSSGIGLALAKRLVREGCHVAILSRHNELLQSAINEIKQVNSPESQPVISLQADVTKRDELQARLDEYTSLHGMPDIVINCAGVAHPGTFTSLKPEIFEWLMDVNYFGTVNVLKTLVPGMKARRSGVIVNISSIAGFLGVYGYTAYSASKFAVTGFSDALRSELKPYNIKVSIVFPPDTQTPQLEYEEQFKPFITKQVAGSAKLMSAEAVADEIVAKVKRGKYIILPGMEGKVFYTLHNLVGRTLYPVIDMLVNSAIAKIKIG